MSFQVLLKQYEEAGERMAHGCAVCLFLYLFQCCRIKPSVFCVVGKRSTTKTHYQCLCATLLKVVESERASQGAI